MAVVMAGSLNPVCFSFLHEQVTGFCLEQNKQKKLYLIDRKAGLKKVFQDWSRSSEGHRDIFYLVESSLKASSKVLQTVKDNTRAEEVADGMGHAGSYSVFGYVWSDIIYFAEAGNKFYRALEDWAFSAMKVARLGFVLAKMGKDDDGYGIEQMKPLILQAEAEKVLKQKSQNVLLKGETFLYSSGKLTKDILKIIKKLAKTSFHQLGLVLKFLTPGLMLWRLRFKGAELYRHWQVNKLLSEQAQLEINNLKSEIVRKKAAGEDYRIEEQNLKQKSELFIKSQKVVKTVLKHEVTRVILEAISFSIAVISLAFLLSSGPMPLDLDVAFAIAGFIILLIACANDIAKKMNGGFFEVKDEEVKNKLLHQLFPENQVVFEEKFLEEEEKVENASGGGASSPINVDFPIVPKKDDGLNNGGVNPEEVDSGAGVMFLFRSEGSAT